jgi:hypothetical protein
VFAAGGRGFERVSCILMEAGVWLLLNRFTKGASKSLTKMAKARKWNNNGFIKFSI